MSTIHSHHGVIHGKTIELDEDTGLPEGQKVTVSVKPISSNAVKLALGEGLRKSFGAWSDDAEELDKFLEWNRQQRKIDRTEIEP